MAIFIATAVLSVGVLAALLDVFSGSGFQIQAQSNDIDSDFLETWEAPRELRKNFPYYISGLDYDGQPVMVFEYGKWKVREYLEAGGDSKALDMYIDQCLYRWGKAEKNLPPNENSTGTGFFGLIVDMDGFEIRQLTHGPSIAFIVRMTRNFVAAGGTGSRMDYAFLINMNYVADMFVTSLIAPILGELFSKVETGGTNMEKWVPKMLKKIPRESLPTWYGGTADFRPLAVYG